MKRPRYMAPEQTGREAPPSPTIEAVRPPTEREMRFLRALARFAIREKLERERKDDAA